MRTSIAVALCLFAAALPSPCSAQSHKPGTASGTASTAAADPQFQRAYAAFQAKRYTEADATLRTLLKQKPSSFPANELLGLVLAAQGNGAAAVAQLRTALQLQPNSAPAHDNLATALAGMGDLSTAASEWRLALQLQPTDPVALRDLSRLLLQQNRVADATPLLRAAHTSDPASADTTYNLAVADTIDGDLSEAKQLLTSLLAHENRSEYHLLLGKLNEKQASYVEAAREFAAAAALDPSEENLFTWGSEFLLHRAYQPAIQIFQQGTQRFPTAPRLWVGLGMAQYSRGEYEPAIRALLTAADLDATDPRCYFFLSRAYLSAPAQAEEVIACFRRYAEMEPHNAKAQFYYAVSLWKGRRADAQSIDTAAVEKLFLQSLALNSNDAETHRMLGDFYNDQRSYAKALPEFQRAEQLDPQLPDTHFRLGRAYLREGEKDKSQAEFDTFKRLQAEHQAQLDKERAEVQQFVIATEAAPATAGQP